MSDTFTVQKMRDMMAALSPAPPPTTIVKHPQFPLGAAWKILDDDGSVWLFMNSEDLTRLTKDRQATATPTIQQMFSPVPSFAGIPVMGFEEKARAVFQRALERMASSTDKPA